jgi:hypothetical protein
LRSTEKLFADWHVNRQGATNCLVCFPVLNKPEDGDCEGDGGGEGDGDGEGDGGGEGDGDGKGEGDGDGEGDEGRLIPLKTPLFFHCTLPLRCIF